MAVVLSKPAIAELFLSSINYRMMFQLSDSDSSGLQLRTTRGTTGRAVQVCE